MSSDFTIRPPGSPGSNAIRTIPSVAIEQNALIPALPPLSDELVVKILGYLNPCELATCSLVCKHLNIVSAENSLWRSLFQRSFGPHGNLENKDFLKAYKDQHRIASNFTNGVYASHYLSDAGMCKSFALSADGKQLFSSSFDFKTKIRERWTPNTPLHAIKIWDPETGACLRTGRPMNSIVSLALSSDGKRLVSASPDNTIKIWDPETGTCLHTFTEPTGVGSLVLSADGKRLFSGSNDGKIIMRDLETGTCLDTLTGHTKGILSLALSADGKRLFSGSWDRTIKVWDPETGTCLDTLTGHTARIFSLALSADGKRLVSCARDAENIAHDAAFIAHNPTFILDDSTIKIWDLEKSTCLHTLTGHGEKFSSLALSADSKRLFSCATSSTVTLAGAITMIAGAITMIKVWDFDARHHAIFKEIADLFRKGDPKAVTEAMDRFSRMPKNERGKVYAELYEILKPFTNDYWGCAEHAFHDQKGLHSTLTQKALAIENCFVRRS